MLQINDLLYILDIQTPVKNLKIKKLINEGTNEFDITALKVSDIISESVNLIELDITHKKIEELNHFIESDLDKM